MLDGYVRMSSTSRARRIPTGVEISILQDEAQMGDGADMATPRAVTWDGGAAPRVGPRSGNASGASHTPTVTSTTCPREPRAKPHRQRSLFAASPRRDSPWA